MSSAATASGVTSTSTPAAAIYRASPIKRARSTKAAVEARRTALFNIVANMQPMTVRRLVGPVTLSGVS